MTQTKKYFRSAEHLEDDAAVLALLKREFPEVEPETLSPVSRRRFVQLLGASAALASATTGCRWETEKIVDLGARPDNRTPGVPQYFSTAMEIAGVALPLRVTCFDGRPIKVEGNPLFAPTGGASSVATQAAMLSFYDPDRSRNVVAKRDDAFVDASRQEFLTATASMWQALRGKQGQGLRVLAQASSSAAMAEVRDRLLRTYPKAVWHEYEAVSDDETRAGTRVAFGAAFRPLYRLERADVVLAIDCDLFGDHPNAIAHSRAFATRRDPDAAPMSRLFAVESSFSATGATADHRLPLRSSLMGVFLNGLEEALGVPGAPGASPLTGESKTGVFIRALAADLNAARGRCLIAIGGRQPAAVQARVHRLNEILGNVGKTVSYVREQLPERGKHVADVKALADAMAGGQVETLVILGGNPVFDAPADAAFGDQLSKVKTTIHLGLYRDETGRRADWHLPLAHDLETFGDARAYDGTLLLKQPMIAPLHGGMSALELTAMIAGDELAEGHDLVRRAFDVLVSTTDQEWRRALRDGFVAAAQWPIEEPTVRADLPPMPAAGPLGDDLDNGRLEIDFVPCPKVYDGRFANNGWLQELPDFMTRMTWDNVALIAPRTAKALGVATEDLVTLKLGDRSVDCAVYVMPGQAPGAVTVWLGYGRTAAGGVGGDLERDVAPVGFDVQRLRTTESFWFATGLSVAKKGETYRLAMVQDHHMMDTVGMKGREERIEMLIHEGDVAEYRTDPKSVHGAEHGPPLKSLWDPPATYETGHKWGLAIDLATCTGCSACVIACQAENNIPVVGKERVWRSREMHWLRIDRYFEGDVDDPAVAHQPVACQQCENAPCEQVCPVGATMHSKEGLNDMVYNRCVGTRYCSNNCPYKVRRFNFFNYHLDLKEPENEVLKMVFNPEVTVRARGVMEKCTYCTHRITMARQAAKNAGRQLKDGDVVTACQQVCPSQSIVFGDLNDPESKVARKHANPRSYAMLAFLNVKPRTEYLARITNRNPALVKAKPAGAANGH
jgi:MoCo/4Fe-4S cofactor protein with predicted Tat translocation signal